MVGLGFCSLQALSYSGIIYLDWKELEKAVQAKLDRNGDGKVCCSLVHGNTILQVYLWACL